MSTTTETPATQPVRELHRSRDDRYLAGVAGGMGRYFDISPTFFRLAFVLLTFAGGSGILLYVVAALIVPDEGRDDSVAAHALRRHRDRPWLLFGLALVAIAALSIIAQGDVWVDSGLAWILLILGSLAVVLAQRRGDPPAAVGDAAEARAPRRSVFLPGVALLLAAAGILALVESAGVDVRWDVALAVAAIATAAAVVGAWFFDRRAGGLAVVGVLLAALAVAAAAVDVPLAGPIGERTYAPPSTSEVRADYDVAIGELTVDLTNVRFVSGRHEIDANVGIGQLNVAVPADVNVEVEASASGGDVEVFGRRDEGENAELTERWSVPGSDVTLVLDAHVGFGEVNVERGR